jgi:hypothetical protein
VFQVYAPNRQFSKREPDEVAFFVFHGATAARTRRRRTARRTGWPTSSAKAPSITPSDAATKTGLETYKVPGEKIVYAHVSDATVMMYRIPAFDAYVPDQHEVLQRM